MADSASPDHSVDTSKVETANHADAQSASESSPGKGVDAVKLEAASLISLSPGSALSSLRSSPANGLPTATHTASSGAPQQKKFTHSNINKKFLEKTHPSSIPSQTLAASTVAKSGTSIPKPSLQSAPSHSRLVTAKLTATAHSTTGPGWSRPPSSVSSATPALPSSTNSKQPVPPGAPASSGSSTVQPVGKVIQPQPRGATEMFATSVKKESNGKPVWGSTRTAAAVINELDAVASDFPTAAEVAQGNAFKLSAKKDAAQAAAAQKEAIAAELTAEADTFRGVHLDPNAHHWDEIEEDDDNFLDAVIDFGDGRQYKVEATAASQQQSSQDALQISGNAADARPATDGVSTLNEPVSKEERFADDFDRSWPRTRVKTNFTNGQREHYANGAPSSASSQSVHSPSDSKVLFNERSNRLEPYSSVHSHHRQSTPGQTPYSARQGSRSDHGGSPVESRGSRDIPPHVHPDGVQLLQKASGYLERRPDGVRHPGDRAPSGNSEDPYHRQHEREPYRHDQVPAAFSRTYSQGSQGRGHDHSGPYDMVTHSARHDDRSPRPSFSHSLPHPSHSPRDAPKELSRQLPPHLSVLRSPHAPRLPLLSDAHWRETSGLAAEPPPEGPRSPATSLDPRIAAPPPAVPTESAAATSVGPLIDLTEAQKKEMHSAAERARLRRQQEEEDREREKERARRKAAELEAQFKAKEVEKTPEAIGLPSTTDSQVVGVIEDAVRSAIPSTGGILPGSGPRSAPTPTFGRPASLRGDLRPGQGRRMSSSIAAGSEVPSSAAEVESWRIRALPRSLTLSDSNTGTSVVPPPSLPLLAEVESLHLAGGHDVEVIDFSELGKFVGAERSARSAHSERTPTRPPRLSAADFFEDDRTGPGASSQTATGNDSSWRRRTATHDSQPLSDDLAPPSRTRDKLRVQIIQSDPSISPGSSPLFHTRVSPPHYRQHDDRLHPSAVHVHPGHHGHSLQRSPLTPSFREAPIAALDDVISRIKGALDDMHPKEELLPKAQKWIPPALRLKNSGHDMARPSEPFDVTASEPPRSPKPAWKVFAVKLPKTPSRNLPALSTRQLLGFQRANVLWSAVYSWVPPIGGKSHVDVSVEDHLFGGSSAAPNRVALPRKQLLLSPASPGQAGPVVNLPSKPSAAHSVTSTSREVEAISRRKPSSSQHDNPVSGPGLNTTSRSPPPEVPPGTTASLPKSEPTSPSRSTDSQGKPQPQSKTQQTLVGSIVESDGSKLLEGATAKGRVRRNDVQPTVGSTHTASGREHGNKPLAEPSVSASTIVNKHSVDHPGPTSSGAVSNPWSKSPRAFSLKDSPSRGVPDPEHLKAVWSQASDKAALPSVNSLEGIADDLTAVPFTIQDVKSEDGGTPPPSGQGLSRMSSYDVTRAFQQVPTSSVKSPQRSTILPAPVVSVPNGPVPRPAYSYTPLRPAYPYPSPVLSHSPSPTIVYPPQMAPSPAPRPMVLNGPPSPYGQPMWMPMGGPQPQNPLMRSMASPYAPQYVPYPSPGAVPMYVPGTPQPPGGVPGRVPAVPMMSPMMQPPALYGGSPVMMHSPHVPPPQAYANNRGQPGVNFEHASGRSQPGQPPQQPYTTNAFVVRPTW